MALVIGLGQSVLGAGLLRKPNYRPEDCAVSRADVLSFSWEEVATLG